MEGLLEELISKRMDGVVALARHVGRETVGSSPGARRRVRMWLTLPPASSSVSEALLLVGFETPRELRLPVKAKITLDDAGVSRELRPQFSVGLDETIYHKVIFNIRPTHGSRIVARDFHKVSIFYDALHPIIIRDITLLVSFNINDIKSLFSMLTGAKVLEPGEVTVEYPPFFNSIGGERRASLVIHSPYHESRFKVVVAGSESEIVAGSESFVIEVPFSYWGNLVPVSIKYEDIGYKFYPRKAVVTDIVLAEIKLPEDLGIRLETKNVRRENDSIVINGIIINKSKYQARNPNVIVKGLNYQLARVKWTALGPNEVRPFSIKVSLAGLPLKPESLYLYASCFILGMEFEDEIEIKL